MKQNKLLQPVDMAMPLNIEAGSGVLGCSCPESQVESFKGLLLLVKMAEVVDKTGLQLKVPVHTVQAVCLEEGRILR